MLKKQKGITLVALVVTIVVLLILAGVSINLVLGDNGIVKKAQGAKTKSAEASQNDLTSMDELAKELEDVINENGNIDDESKFMKENTKVTYPDGDVWIPEGLKIADDSASNVQGGVVIEDKDGNQFVWVPVATIADYKRTAYKDKDLTGFYTEILPEDERASVEKYKGFYIGRYEAGDKESTENKMMRPDSYESNGDNTNTVTIKANQAPYNYVTRMQTIGLAEGFATKQGYKAKTKLVSSYAWDTTIEFIQKTNSDYGSSSEEGNYRNTTFEYRDITGAGKTKELELDNDNTGELIPTGQTTPVCNIYDMGGNVWERTTESSTHPTLPYTVRGGGHDLKYEYEPAGIRHSFADAAGENMGFRITLFM